MTSAPAIPQRILPLRDKPAGQLLIHEIYHSIQGESTYAGLPCVFVRLAICDLRCVWCDTPHAFTQGYLKAVDDIVSQVRSYRCDLVEITGGEPLLQSEVFSLMTRLADQGFKVLLETSGSHDISQVDPRVQIIMDLKCPDSGESAANLWSNVAVLKPQDEIKFVVASRHDFDWAVKVIEEYELERRVSLLISPAFGVLELRSLAEWVLSSGVKARLQLQLHKYIWEPQARGV